MIKILYYYQDMEDAMHQWQHYHIMDELASHSIEVKIFNPLKYASLDEANEKLIKELKTNSYNLFMTPAKDGTLFPQTICHIKNLGIPTLLICFDNLTVPFNHRNTAPLYDLVWLTSRETEYLFNKWGANTIFLPYAANPFIIKPNYTQDIESVLFIGTPYGSRCKMINNLIKNNIKVNLYGNAPNFNNTPFLPTISKYELFRELYRMLSYPIGRKLAYASFINKITKKSQLLENNEYLIRNNPVDLKTMMELYSKYALSLSSVTNRHTGILKNPVLITNLRSFEIPAAGGLLFCQYNSELNEYFTDKKEAIYYVDDRDMIEKAKFYLSPKRKDERMKIKINARKKAEYEHNWFSRFQVIFQKLNIR